MISATAAVLIDAAIDLPKRRSSRLCFEWKNAAKIAAHASGAQERLEQLVKKVTEKEDASVEQQHGASLPRELIRHLLRI